MSLSSPWLSLLISLIALQLTLAACVGDPTGSQEQGGDAQSEERRAMTWPDSRPPKDPPSDSSPYSIHFSVTGRTSNTLTIRWNALHWAASDGVSDYELYRGTSESGDYQRVASIDGLEIDGNAFEFVDSGLEPETAYYYMIRGCNSGGCSGFSSEVAAGVTEALREVAIPATPVSWRASPPAAPGKPESVIAVWGQTPGATFYQIHGEYDAGGVKETEVSAPQGSHQFGVRQDLGQLFVGDADVIVAFKIRACNKAGCSAFAEPVGAWPGFENSVFMSGPCRPGLKVNPGEGCFWNDGDTVFYVSGKKDEFIGEHLGCLSLKADEPDTYCEFTLMGWDADSDLYAAPTSSGEWFVRSKTDRSDTARVTQPTQPSSGKATSKPAVPSQAEALPIGDPDLFDAIWRGQIDEVKSLIEGGKDVNVKDEDGDPFLHEAIWRGHIDVVRVLIDAGADVNTSSADGDPLLLEPVLKGDTDLVRILIEAGADVNARTRNGRSLLGVGGSLWRGNREVRQMLVDAGATEVPERPEDLQAKSDGYLADIILSWRAPSNHVQARVAGYRIEVSEDRSNWHDLVANTESNSTNYTHRGLLSGTKRHYRVSAINSFESGRASLVASIDWCKGSQNLMEGIWSGEVEVVRCVLGEFDPDVNKRDSRGAPVFMRALVGKDPEILRLLLDAGADVNATDSEGNPVLMQAILGENPEILRLLLDAGADVSATDSNGDPMLRWAIWEENSEILRLLLDAGADANATDSRGTSMLRWAHTRGKPELVKILAAAGADVNAKDSSGDPLLSYVITAGPPEILRILVDAGADVNSKTAKGDPMLWWAIIGDNSEEMLRILVDAGADVNATDSRGNPMLSQAISEETTQVVRILVDAGADVNATDPRGNPMLLWAILEENPEIVRILVDAGADVNYKDPIGDSMLYRALRKDNPAIVQILIDAGATK